MDCECPSAAFQDHSILIIGPPQFWNFKTEISELAGDLSRQWYVANSTSIRAHCHSPAHVVVDRSYLDGVKRGYLTADPSAVHDPNVCAPYVGQD